MAYYEGLRLNELLPKHHEMVESASCEFGYLLDAPARKSYLDRPKVTKSDCTAP
jgi:hypothetical protein